MDRAQGPIVEHAAEVIGRYVREPASSVIIALPGELAAETCEALLAMPKVAGLVVSEAVLARARRPDGERIGVFQPESYQWRLPACRACCVVFFGSFGQLSFRMVKAALRQGVSRIVYRTAGSWRREHAAVFILRRCIERAGAMVEVVLNRCGRTIRARAHELRAAAERPIRKHAALWALPVFAARRAWKPVLQHAGALSCQVFIRASGGIRQALDACMRGLFERCSPAMQEKLHRARRRAGRQVDSALRLVFGSRRVRRSMRRMLEAGGVPILDARCFAPRRVLLVNSSLAWGGAERQIVNTLTGLKARGGIEASLLVQHLHDRPDHDFYLWQLEQAGIAVRQLRGSSSPATAGLDATRLEVLHRALAELPPMLSDDIMRYALEFAEMRPGVVHLWQDSVSVLAGLAAALVGVPRIVLGSRNMSPIHFAYHLPYMRPGYQVLAKQPRVALVNNSRAGARDYARWLGLPPGRYGVVYNGIRPEALQAPAAGRVIAYRESLGLPPGCPVVGSIFRFYPEKDPFLWVDTVARVARARPECMFLLIGTGVMKDELVAYVEAAGLQGRLIMPGTEKDPVLPLSLMDVFLLTSKMEGTPNVVIEAQWMGVPVVATEAGGTRDAVEHGVTGWIVGSRDADELAAKVIETLESQDWSARARRRAQEFAQERFGFDHMIDNTLRLYGMSAEPFAADSAGLTGAPLSAQASSR